MKDGLLSNLIKLKASADFWKQCPDWPELSDEIYKPKAGFLVHTDMRLLFEVLPEAPPVDDARADEQQSKQSTISRLADRIAQKTIDLDQK